MERNQDAAPVAHQVVMVDAFRIDPFIAGRTVAHLELVDELVVLEQLQAAVDACPGDSTAA